MPQITFLEYGEKRSVPLQDTDQTLLELSLAAHIPHYHDCGGCARCTTCRVRVLQGLENLSPRSGVEDEVARTRQWPEEIRLACQSIPLDDLTVERLVRDDDQRYQGQPEHTGSIRSEELPVVILFCDIHDFTRFSHGHMPYDVVHVMNRFYLRIGEAVLSHGGHIDKYLGDGMMAIWGHDGGDPTQFSIDALHAALLMQSAVDELNTSLAPHFDNDLILRIGMHFGPAIIGMIGHPAQQQLTAIGDTVNIASRVENVNKEMNTHFLITEEYYQLIKQHVAVGEHFRTLLRGQPAPHQLYEIVGLSNPDWIFIVQNQMNRIILQGDQFTQRFYNHMFENFPETKKLFTHVPMARQRDVLFQMLTYAVRDLRHFDQKQKEFDDLAQRHVTYGVKAYHYDQAGQSMIVALEQTLGDDFDQTARGAWLKFYQTISTPLKNAAPA